MRKLPKLISALLVCGISGLMAGVVLQPIPAPDWEISAWFNDDPGSLRDQRGRVVLIGFFQLWCPGCKEFSIPLFRRWSELYGDREDVVIVFVHSVFESHDYQSPDHLREFIRENGISHPVGIDAYDVTDDDVPVTMRRYQAGGTPHLAIVDKEGMLRFAHFGIFDPEPAEGFIERLLNEPPGAFDRESETAPLAERFRPVLDRSLSGTYVFRTDQATGICATWIPRMEVPAELRVYRDEIDIEFRQSFLGMGEMEVLYDAQTGRVEGENEVAAAAPGGGITSTRVLRLEGVLDGQADPPELEFELTLMDGMCAIQGRAHREP